jgi:hypothetical protein
VVFLATFLDLTGLLSNSDLFAEPGLVGFVEAEVAGPFADLPAGFLPNAAPDLLPSN